MKRIDRAMFAIFLLALLADVARAHAAVPAGDDAGFILSAASQFQAGPADGALLDFRQPNGSALPIATLDRFALTFSGWSSLFSHALLPSRSGPTLPCEGTQFPLPAFDSKRLPNAKFRHQGSPAP